MDKDIEQSIRSIFAEVFDLPIEEITDQSNPDNIKKWDSLGHINLILALEEKFKITFSPESVVEMMSVQAIRTLLFEIETAKNSD